MINHVCNELYCLGKLLAENLFPNDIGTFVDDCCDCWEAIANVPQLPVGSDEGAALSSRLRKLIPIAKGNPLSSLQFSFNSIVFTFALGTLKKMLGAFMVISPHSMQVERVLSHFNLVADDRRSTIAEDTINAHLLVALNGTGTATYDPRPAVALFLERRKRRYQEPDLCIYSERQFARKFFRKESAL